VQPCCAARRAPPVRATERPEIGRQVCNVPEGWQPANRQRACAIFERIEASGSRPRVLKTSAAQKILDCTEVILCINSPLLPTARIRVSRSTHQPIVRPARSGQTGTFWSTSAVHLVAGSTTSLVFPQIARTKTCTTPRKHLYEAIFLQKHVKTCMRLHDCIFLRLLGCTRSFYESRFLRS